MDIFSLNLDFFKKISENSNITYGLEMIENKVGSFAKSININDLSETPISTRYPDNSSLNSLGLYINYKTKIIEDVFFQSGVRYSSTVLKSDLSQNNIFIKLINFFISSNKFFWRMKFSRKYYTFYFSSLS